MKSAFVLLTLVVAVLGVSNLAAQAQICSDTDTVDDCSGRVSSRMGAENGQDSTQADASLQLQEAELTRKPTGITAVGSGLTSAISDFLPILAGALGFSPSTTEDGAAAFETNLRIPVGAAPQKLRLQAVLRDPAIYEPLRATLPQATREERAAVLGRELGDFDDLRLTLAWNLESRSFGRSFGSYRALHDALFRLELDQFSQRPGVVQEKGRIDREAQRAYREVTTSIEQDSLVREQGCTYDRLQVGALQLRCLKESMRDRLVEVINRAVHAAEAVESEFDDQLERSGFYDLADLVNNQPQLSAQFAVDVRRDLVGPNEASASVRYETGFTNMNALRRACQPGTGVTITLECLRAYTKARGNQASLKRGDRFFITATYSRRQDYAVTLADDGVNFVLAGTWDLTGELGYGRYVAFSRAGEQIGRIDLSAQYIHHQNDPAQQNRFVGAATYTQRVSEALSLAAGFAYASKPEFLGEVDRKVSANFGLRYKLVND